jgi:hypothetical protein
MAMRSDIFAGPAASLIMLYRQGALGHTYQYQVMLACALECLFWTRSESLNQVDE